MRWPQAWSRHSREIIAVKWEPDGTSLWAIPEASPQGGRRLSRPGPYGVSRASLSADERWLAYDSNETGRSEVYLQPFDNLGERRRISSSGGSQPLWRQDGRELFYISPDSKLMAVEVGTRPSFEVGPPHVLFQTRILPPIEARNHYDAAADGQRFVVNSRLPEDASLPITVVSGWIPEKAN